MNLQSIVLAVLSGFLVFTYQPPRPPVLDPDVAPFHYDPNLCLSEPLGYAVIPACTPDFFLFDSDKTLVYRGQLDDSRPGNGIPVIGTDLTAAIDAVLEGKPVSKEQKPSIGCNIKWK